MLGWYGVFAILGAYVLLNFGLLNVRSVIYQLLNLTGAGAFILETSDKKDYQPMFLNVVWLLVAAIALLRLFI